MMRAPDVRHACRCCLGLDRPGEGPSWQSENVAPLRAAPWPAVKLDRFPSLEKVAAFLRTAATNRVKQGLVDTAHEIAVRHGYISAKATASTILKP